MPITQLAVLMDVSNYSESNRTQLSAERRVPWSLGHSFSLGPPHMYGRFRVALSLQQTLSRESHF